MLYDAINVGSVFMKAIIAILIQYVQPDRQATRQANGKTRDINGRVSLVFREASPSDFKITFIHTVSAQIIIFFWRPDD